MANIRKIFSTKLAVILILKKIDINQINTKQIQVKEIELT